MFLTTQSGLDRGWIILVNNEITDRERARGSILILRALRDERKTKVLRLYQDPPSLGNSRSRRHTCKCNSFLSLVHVFQLFVHLSLPTRYPIRSPVRLSSKLRSAIFRAYDALCVFCNIKSLFSPFFFSLIIVCVVSRRLVDGNNISSICLSPDVSSLFLSLFFQSSSFTHTALLSPFSSRPTRVFVSTHETPDAF